jgi:nicotinate-nucleotide adenylyltransferase
VKIGLYFGSFNPIHVGHLIIANHILNDSELERIWFIVSPLNPFKESQNLMNEYDRLHLVKKAIEEDPRLKANDIEFLLAKPSYTVHTLAYLKEKYPEHSFSLIMGSDGFQNLHKWKNPEIIVKNYPIVIYRRLGFEVNNKLNAQITVMNAPLLEISSTHIRELVKVGKSIKYLVPSSIEEDILSSHFFGKDQKK